MVQVPTLTQSEESLKPTPVNPKTAATLGGEIADLGQGLSSLGDYFEKLRDDTEITKAKTAYNDSIKQAHGMALTDPDPWTANKRIDDYLQKSKENIAQSITGGEARNKFIDSADAETDRRSYSFDSTLMYRQINDSKNAKYNAIDSLISDGKAEIQPPERERIRQQIIDTGNSLKTLHGIDSKTVDTYITNKLRQMDNDNIASDMNNDAVGTLHQIELGKNGQYSHLEDTQRSYWLDKAKQAVIKQDAQNKEIFTIARNANEEDLLKRRWNGEAGLDDKVVKLAANHTISNDFAKAWQNANESSKTVKAVTDAGKYMDLMDEMSNTNIPAQQKRTDVLKGIADGWLTESDAKNMYHSNYIPDATGDQTSLMKKIGQINADQRDNIIADNQEKKQASNNILSWMGGVIDAIKKYTSNIGKQSTIAQAVNKQIVDSKAKPNEFAGIAVQHINADVLKSHPWIKSYPKEGVVKKDKYGNNIRFFPDGSYRVEEQNAS